MSHSVISDRAINVDPTHERDRRQSIMATSSPLTDAKPIDCILVYNSNVGNDKDGSVKISERREQFETHLRDKQKLEIQRFTPSGQKPFGYVIIHTPFEILRQTAEKIRMRLPIEEIAEDDNRKLHGDNSPWNRFTARIKKPFRLAPELAKTELNYHTAIYSTKNPEFKRLFKELRGSEESYFTPSERSLLTQEILTRTHWDDGDGDGDNKSKNQQESVINRLAEHSVVPPQRGSKRPGIDRLVTKKAYDCYYPLHESIRKDMTGVPDDQLNEREKLTRHWATMRQCFKFQPLSLIRSYMGEKVAFYFALSGFYNQMLILPAIIGLIIFIYGASTVYSDQPTSDICGDFGHSIYMCPTCDIVCPFWQLSDSCVYSKVSYVFDNAATVVFAVIMSLWARWFVEHWKRRQAVLQYEWDSIDFEAHLEPIRPAFEQKAKFDGELLTNPVTKIEEPYISMKKRIPFFLLAGLIVVLTISIICGITFTTVVYRIQMDYILNNTAIKGYSSIIITITSAAINLICSLILSILYYWLARKLTDFELHKYQTKHDDSLIIKIYIFEFLNFYSSLFYVAFFKGRFLEYPSKYGTARSNDFTEQCDPAGCLVELSIQLIVIMIGKQIVSLIYQLIMATWRTWKGWFNSDKNGDEKQWEKDRKLNDFGSNVLIDEYLELVIQFGFVTLFVVAFPLAPLFALINNLIELRLDAWKFLSKHKRPIPFKASDIGIWSHILSAISYIAVLTNAVVIAWTSEFIPKMAYRSLQSQGTSLNGYVNWTLSSFPISGYSATGTTPNSIPPGLTYCRYRDFRDSTGPSYSQTSLYWNVTAARLAFIVIFEHAIFFIIYLIQWLISDVPKNIRDKIDHERYIDQCERWGGEWNNASFNEVGIASKAVSKMANIPNNDDNKTNDRTRIRSPIGKGRTRVGIMLEEIH